MTIFSHKTNKIKQKQKFLVGRTDWVLDENHLVCFDEWPHANDVLRCDPEEVALSVDESLDHGVVPGHGVGHRSPAHTVGLPLFNDIVGDGGAAVILRRVPGEPAGVAGQVLAGEWEPDWARDIWWTQRTLFSILTNRRL